MINFFYKKVTKIALNNDLISKKNAIKLLNILKYRVLTCEICKEPINPNNRNRHLSFDHIKPRSLGGNGDFENLRIAHKICNIKRGDR